MQRRFWGVVTAGALCLALAGCGDDSPPQPQASAPPAPATSSAAPSASPSPSESSSSSSSNDLAGVVMKESDISRTDLTVDEDGVEDAPGGKDLSQATLDFCGGTFRSEGSREERYAVDAGFTKPQLGAIYNEVVRYSSSDDAETALDEFRTSVRDCDGGSYPSVLNDGKDVTFDPQQGPSSVDELDNNNTVVQSKLTSEGQTYNITTFIAQYDDALVITHAATQGAAQTAVNKAVGTIGALVGQRL